MVESRINFLVAEIEGTDSSKFPVSFEMDNLDIVTIFKKSNEVTVQNEHEVTLDIYDLSENELDVASRLLDNEPKYDYVLIGKMGYVEVGRKLTISYINQRKKDRPGSSLIISKHFEKSDFD